MNFRMALKADAASVNFAHSPWQLTMLVAMRRASSCVSSLAAVGPGEQLRMNFEAKRLGGLEVFVGKGSGL